MRFILLVLILTAGCSTQAGNLDVYIQNPSEFWLQTATYLASDFWESHGVNFYITDDADLKVSTRKLDDPVVGEFYGTVHTRTGDIFVDPIMDPDLGYSNDRYNTCIMAHEMFHSIGADHVPQGLSLMAPALEGFPADAKNDGICYWSQDDQDQFCKATNRGCDIKVDEPTVSSALRFEPIRVD